MENKNKKRRLKKKYRILLRKIKKLVFLLCFIAIILLFIYMLFGGFTKNVKDERIVKSFSYIDNKIVLKTRKHDKKLYCILSSSTPKIDDENWTIVENNECNLKYELENYKLYIKTDDKIIYSTEDDKDVYLEVNENKNKI